MQHFELPGSRTCVGCGGATFRNRGDNLCPRCAYGAEDLIEQIEVDSLHRDLALMTSFEAYYFERERQHEQAAARGEEPGLKPAVLRITDVKPLTGPDAFSLRPDLARRAGSLVRGPLFEPGQRRIA